MLEIQQLETWLWDAACAIRGPVDAPRFKDYILPLVFLKRLSDVFDDELEQLAEEYGSRETAARQVEWDHKLVRFYIPPEARWDSIRPVTTGLGQYLTDAMRAVARENPKLQGVIDTVDFNATAAGQRILDDPQTGGHLPVAPFHIRGAAPGHGGLYAQDRPPGPGADPAGDGP